MHCNTCGCEIEKGMFFCPACGAKINDLEADDDLRSKLGFEVDRVMSAGSNLRDINDGVEIVDGQMAVTDPEAANESIFTPEDENITEESVREDIQHDFEDLDLTEDYEDVPVISIVRDTDLSDEGANIEPDIETASDSQRGNPPEKKKANGTDVFLVIIVIIMGLAAAAYLIFGILLKDNQKSENELPSTPVIQSEPESAENIIADTITSNLENGKEYEPPLKITLTSEHGYRMYYTLDGTDPTTSSSMYNGSFTLKERDLTENKQEFILNVYSFTSNGKQAGKYKCTFTLALEEISAPVITPSSGNYTENTEITITASPGTKIYYTYGTDEDPDTSSMVYSGSVKMKRGSNVLKAVAVKNGRSGDIASAVFNLSIPSEISYDEALALLKEQLTEEKVMNDDGTAPSGGRIMIGGSGKALIDEESYYCFAFSETDAEGVRKDDRYFGVNDIDGSIIVLARNEDGSFKIQND